MPTVQFRKRFLRKSVAMRAKLISRVTKAKTLIRNTILGSRVKNKDFTIISSNCWGSGIYQELNVPYNTPFVGLFFFAPCYLKLLKNLSGYLSSDLTFTTMSRYSIANEARRANFQCYPIGILKATSDEVEVHFLHYKNQDEARMKWFSRRERMNMNNLFIGFDDRDLCEWNHLHEFDQLDFRNKVVFTARHYPEIESSVWLREYANQPHVTNLFVERFVYRRHFDVANWLNGGVGRVSFLIGVLTKLLEVRD